MGWCLQSRIVLPRQKSSISVEERWKSLHLWLSLLSHSHPCSRSLNAGSWKTLQLSCRRIRLGFLSQGFGHPQSPSLSFTFSVVSASFRIPHVASVDAWTHRTRWNKKQEDSFISLTSLLTLAISAAQENSLWWWIWVLSTLLILIGTSNVWLSDNWNVTNVTDKLIFLFLSYLKFKSQPIKSKQVLNSFPQSQYPHFQCLISHHVASGYIIGQCKSR